MSDLKFASVKEGIQNPKAQTNYCAACLYWNKLFGADLLAWTSFLETPRINLKGEANVKTWQSKSAAEVRSSAISVWELRLIMCFLPFFFYDSRGSSCVRQEFKHNLVLC